MGYLRRWMQKLSQTDDGEGDWPQANLKEVPPLPDEFVNLSTPKKGFFADRFTTSYKYYLLLIFVVFIGWLTNILGKARGYKQWQQLQSQQPSFNDGANVCLNLSLRHLPEYSGLKAKVLHTVDEIGQPMKYCIQLNINGEDKILVVKEEHLTP